MTEQVDVIIIGAGASGLMCAIEAGKRGRKVLVLDHARKAGLKILMSGGGRCNFTNYSVEAENFISNNPHFCKSALSRFTQWDFLDLIQKYKISFHEREHGQLFCDESSRDLLNMLLQECEKVEVDFKFKTEVNEILTDKSQNYKIKTSKGDYICDSLVIATGGLSIPTAGASSFGYKIAEQFGIKVNSTFPALVPFTLQPKDKEKIALLAGIAVRSTLSCNSQSFCENLLFTHRGLSGPAVLQISNYWKPGDEIKINLLPDTNLIKLIESGKPEKQVKSILSDFLPKRLITTVLDSALAEIPLKRLAGKDIQLIIDSLQNWSIKPGGTEGYRTAEVTSGGVDCNEISSKTMESIKQKGLFFTGEVLDVTGWLGGYNLQWAWSSGWCAGQYA